MLCHCEPFFGKAIFNRVRDCFVGLVLVRWTNTAYSTSALLAMTRQQRIRKFVLYSVYATHPLLRNRKLHVLPSRVVVSKDRNTFWESNWTCGWNGFASQART